MFKKIVFVGLLLTFQMSQALSDTEIISIDKNAAINQPFISCIVRQTNKLMSFSHQSGYYPTTYDAIYSSIKSRVSKYCAPPFEVALDNIKSNYLDNLKELNEYISGLNALTIVYIETIVDTELDNVTIRADKPATGTIHTLPGGQRMIFNKSGKWEEYK